MNTPDTYIPDTYIPDTNIPDTYIYDTNAARFRFHTALDLGCPILVALFATEPALSEAKDPCNCSCGADTPVRRLCSPSHPSPCHPESPRFSSRAEEPRAQLHRPRRATTAAPGGAEDCSPRRKPWVTNPKTPRPAWAHHSHGCPVSSRSLRRGGRLLASSHPNTVSFRLSRSDGDGAERNLLLPVWGGHSCPPPLRDVGSLPP